MAEQPDSTPPPAAPTERSCEYPLGCDRPARPGGTQCWAHYKRMLRRSGNRGPIAARHATPWERLSEAALVYGDAKPAQKLKARQRLRSAALGYMKWERSGGQLGPSMWDRLLRKAVSVTTAMVEAQSAGKVASLTRAADKLEATARLLSRSPWQYLSEAALAYSDVDPADDAAWSRAAATLRDAARSYFKWKRAGGR